MAIMVEISMRLSERKSRNSISQEGWREIDFRDFIYIYSKRSRIPFIPNTFVFSVFLDLFYS